MVNKTDPVCGMLGVHKVHGKWFCSYKCLRDYEKKHNLAKGVCPTCALKPLRWYKEKFFIVSFITVFVLIVSYFVTFFNPVFEAFLDYFKMIWWAILLGLLIGGLIERFIPRDYIVKYLAADKKRTILNSVVLGFFMSACSHGILAIAIELYRKGASIPAVITFLLASPWANLTITVILFGFFGIKALLLICSAVLIALITGLAYQVLDKKGWIEKSIKVPVKNFSLSEDLRKRWRSYRFNFDKDIKGVLSSAWSLNRMVTLWILMGMLISSFARAFVPTHIFHQYMGASLMGLLVTLFLAIIIEVCSEGSSPFAFEIFRQTGAFGNSFIFLMAGVTTDYTEIGLLWSNIGKKTALWLPVITVPQILILGYIFNILL